MNTLPPLMTSDPDWTYLRDGHYQTDDSFYGHLPVPSPYLGYPSKFDYFEHSPLSPILHPHDLSYCSSGSSSPSDSPILSPPTAISETTILTQELITITEETLSNYHLIRTEHFPVPSEPAPPNPFLALSLEELERYYIAAIDAKNTLQLRKSAVKADIGNALEQLLPKLSMYRQDEAILDTLADDLALVKGACSNRSLSINFYGLEFRRYLLPQHKRSVLESHSTLFSDFQHALRLKEDSQRAAQKFMEDPYALLEHRLPPFGTTQR